jgi:branched-chain amino acid transport system ATP-binding protein
MLRIDNLTVHYGGLVALNGISLEVQKGEFISVIGPNGAGKTTLFKAISGQVPVAAGGIVFEGKSLLETPAWRRAYMGIAHVPEGRQIFRSLTVEENLLIGLEAKTQHRTGGELNEIYDLFPRLKERTGQLAGSLSGGEQQMVAIGRALISAPQLIMLDEPSLGLAPAIVDQIFDTIVHLHRHRNLTILMVEQRAGEAIESCDRGYILSSGSIVGSGSRAELLGDENVRKAYLAT